MGRFWRVVYQITLLRKIEFPGFPFGVFGKKNSRKKNCPLATVTDKCRIGKTGKVAVLVAGDLGVGTAAARAKAHGGNRLMTSWWEGGEPMGCSWAPN